MARAKLKFRLHRAVIVLFCLTLLVALMQGASWFSQNHQRQRNPQLEELARTLARQVTLNIAPLMRSETPDEKSHQRRAASAHAREPYSGCRRL
ncbi:membrane protein [Salmonella enterica subsp. enterica]|uniref:Membrane protein n=1 Tax=Salmonella enterica I TaxID=59201 RepID=A0A3S4HSD7_SALET|nr:membrane protein [Salmonella enterica subsp. enterica]